MVDDNLAGALASLGHPIRLALYRLLVSAGAEGIGPVAIAGSMGMQRNLVSYHLQPLVAADLVTSERRGRDVNYRAEPVGLNRLARALLALSDPVRSDPPSVAPSRVNAAK
jgi:DNA-binding transcriptional ArsR family regulator